MPPLCTLEHPLHSRTQCNTILASCLASHRISELDKCFRRKEMPSIPLAWQPARGWRAAEFVGAGYEPIRSISADEIVTLTLHIAIRTIAPLD
jgi:hypothetical protein